MMPSMALGYAVVMVALVFVNADWAKFLMGAGCMAMTYLMVMDVKNNKSHE